MTKNLKKKLILLFQPQNILFFYLANFCFTAFGIKIILTVLFNLSFNSLFVKQRQIFANHVH